MIGLDPSERCLGARRRIGGAMRIALSLSTLGLVVACGSGLIGQSSPVGGVAGEVVYELSFPEPEHRWMRVEVTFPDLQSDPLEVRMSRTSPGRYALHEFAKNVFDVQAVDGEGNALRITQPNLHQWNVSGHDGVVQVSYRIYGDRIDGTYLSVDATHAHLNMPATLMWARGLEQRAARVVFARPAGRAWEVATQLFPTSDPLVFTAPNLQYLLDSPAEFGSFDTRTFVVDDPSGTTGRSEFRIALHHDANAREVNAYARDVERIVAETGKIFGVFPEFDAGTYTFIADYLPYAGGDGMEHRNSTILTSSRSLRAGPGAFLGTVAHEFFHAWNVERIRPASLEPFDFEHADVSGELWLAEGFTSYYAPLILHRAGLVPLGPTLQAFAGMINTATLSPGRSLRSAVDMSRLAPFVDAARAVDRTSWENTFISYYTWGAAIGLGLDLALRDRTDGRVSLDDYMRLLWRQHGAPSGDVPGVVATPYTLVDARRVLAEVAADAMFADEFFDRFIEGRDVVDYATLLERAGVEVRAASPGRASWGRLRLSFGAEGARIESAVPFGSPAYDAGLERDDVVLRVDGMRPASAEQLAEVLARRRPQDQIEVEWRRRGEAEPTTGPLVLIEDPTIELAPTPALQDDQQAFRVAWLGGD